MTDIFISYAREDAEFVSRLNQALVEHRRDVWVDLEDILPTAEWEQEILRGIEEADVFVFVISPDSVASVMCGREAAHAAAHHKRVVPILRRDVEWHEAPAPVSTRQWLFAREADDFGAFVSRLLTALDTDLQWAAAHTRLLVQGRDWDRAGRDANMVLRGNELRNAETWLAAADPGKNRVPTALQATFIAESRKAEAERGQRAAELRQELERRQQIALDEQKTARSHELATDARDSLSTDTQLGLLLAMEAALVKPTPLAEDAVRLALGASRLRRAWRAQEGSLQSVAFEPGGTLLVTASWDKTAAVWQAETGTRLAHLVGHSDMLSHASFSPDGQYIVTASHDRTARVWDPPTGDVLGRPFRHDAAVVSAVLSYDARWLVSLSGDLHLWERESGRLVARLQESPPPDGDRYRLVTDWGALSPTLLDAVYDPARGILVVADAYRCLEMWDVASGRLTARVAADVDSPLFDPRGRLVPDAVDRLTAGTPVARRLAVLRGHADSLEQLRFSADGRFVVSASQDRTAALWDARTGERLAEFHHRGQVHSASISPDGDWVVTGTWSGDLWWWEARTGRAAAELRGHNGPVRRATFSLDGSRVLTASEDATARLWADKGAASAVLAGHAAAVTAAVFSPDGRRVATASDDGTARLWETASGEATAVLAGHHSPVRSVAFDAEGSRLVTASADHTAVVWDVPSGRRLVNLKGHRGVLNAASFSPDGRSVLTVSDDHTARIWALDDPEHPIELTTHARAVLSGMFSSDGSLALTSSTDGTAIVWDPATGQAISQVRHHDEGVRARFSPNARLVATASEDMTARLWETRTGRQLMILRGHTDVIYDVQFSPSGQWLATAGQDSVVCVWEVNTGRQLMNLRRHPGWVYAASFAPDSTRLVTACRDGVARIFDCPLCQPIIGLLDMAVPYVRRVLTPEERERYGLPPAS